MIAQELLYAEFHYIEDSRAMRSAGTFQYFILLQVTFYWMIKFEALVLDIHRENSESGFLNVFTHKSIMCDQVSKNFF